MSKEPEEPGGYGHEAFLYPGRAGFLAGVLSFLDPAVRAGQPALVLLPPDQLDLVRREFPAGAATVEYADVTEAGANPAGSSAYGAGSRRATRRPWACAVSASRSTQAAPRRNSRNASCTRPC